MHIPGAQYAGKCVRSPGTRAMNGCELPCGYWKLNLGPLQEQAFATPELYLQLQQSFRIHVLRGLRDMATAFVGVSSSCVRGSTPLYSEEICTHVPTHMYII